MSEQRQSPVMGRKEVLTHRPDLAEIWEEADSCFPIRLTRSVAKRIDWTDPEDPIARQVLPDPRELTDLSGLQDPVGDSACSPLPWVVHKYPSRVLLLLTKRCHLYCRYCFRRTHSPGDAEDPTPEELEAALAYVEQHRPEEVILSGGDPLAIRDSRLFEIIDRLRDACNVIRIHTRAPITRPSRVTPELVEGIRQRGPIWFIVHANHPKELSEDVDEALGRLTNAGIPVLNQAVLLRGINDSVDLLEVLCQELVRRRVFPYYLHLTDEVVGNAHFRVSAEEAASLWKELQKRVSGIALPRLVVDPPDGSGKRDVR